MTDDEQHSEPGYAPSVSDCLTARGVPRHLHIAAKRAFSDWLGSWRGLGQTAESLWADVSR